MKLITPESLALTAAAKWKKQYHSDKPEIYQALLALGDNPTVEQVDRTIGNSTWTTPPDCSECGRSTEAVVMVGEVPDYESHTAWLCVDCIEILAQIVTDAQMSGEIE